MQSASYLYWGLSDSKQLITLFYLQIWNSKLRQATELKSKSEVLFSFTRNNIVSLDAQTLKRLLVACSLRSLVVFLTDLLRVNVEDLCCCSAGHSHKPTWVHFAGLLKEGKKIMIIHTVLLVWSHKYNSQISKETWIVQTSTIRFHNSRLRKSERSYISEMFITHHASYFRI